VKETVSWFGKVRELIRYTHWWGVVGILMVMTLACTLSPVAVPTVTPLRPTPTPVVVVVTATPGPLETLPTLSLDRTLTTGVISSLGRVIERQNDQPLAEVIQTDAAINPGNSGGPLLNSRGQVIGVNTAITSPSGGSVGIGFAVPVDTVKRVVPELIANGRYPHPWIGFEGQAYHVTPAFAEALDLPVDKGLLIARLYQDSPAHQAGLRGADRRLQLGRRVILVGGDIVTAIDGLPLESPDQLTIYLETKKRPGDQVVLTVWRDRKEMTVPLTLGERPEE